MRDVDPGARGHRLHLGAPAAPVLQARARARRGARLRTRAPRGDRQVPSVLVTGASSGIGEACATHLAALGFDVYASVRAPGEAPPGTRELVFDVTDADAVRRALEGIVSLDGLVANAGIAIAAPLELLPPDELTRQLDVNVVGQLRVVQSLLPALRASCGRVVLMGSIGGRSALPFLGAYAMSKFALEAMADVLRLELAPWRIEVSLIEPATIATAMWTKPQEAIDRASPPAVALYRERLEQFRRLAAHRSASAGAPASAVAAVVEHALTAAKPKARYMVGPDAKRRARVERLPVRWRDRVLTRFLFGS